MHSHKLYKGMMERAKECISGMKRRISKDKLNILTSVVALFVLPKKSSMLKSSCRLLCLNHKAKYTKCGFENRTAFDKFMKLKGVISIGETVICRDGFGELKSRTDTSITVCLEPCWQYDRVYTPRSRGRIDR